MKTCNVCNHVDREELERMYLEGKSIRSIEKYCSDNSIPLNYNMLYNHFRKHLKISNFQSSIQSSIPTDLINRLIKNLEICDSKISNMLENHSLDHSILLRYLSEIRQTIAELKSLIRDYNIKPSKGDDIFHLILSLLHDLPIEYIEKLRERYHKYKENPNLPPISY